MPLPRHLYVVAALPASTMSFLSSHNAHAAQLELRRSDELEADDIRYSRKANELG